MKQIYKTSISVLFPLFDHCNRSCPVISQVCHINGWRILFISPIHNTYSRVSKSCWRVQETEGGRERKKGGERGGLLMV